MGFMTKTTLLAALLAVLFTCFYFSFSRSLELVRQDSEQLIVSDFIYHLISVRAVWSKGVSTVYRAETQTQVLSEATGRTMTRAMPEGFSPVCFLLWAPFAWFLPDNPAAAQALWVAASFVLFFYALLEAYAHFRPPLPYFALSVTAALASDAGLRTVLLGQTSLVALACLLLLLVWSERREVQDSLSSLVIPVLGVMILLALKPSYFVIGCSILFIYGKFKWLLFALAAVAAVLLGMTFRLGPSWPVDYAAQLKLYFEPILPEVYAGSISLPTLNNLARLRPTSFVYQLSSWIGLGLSLAALAGSLLLRSRALFARRALVVLVLAGYLLFSPYVPAYDDLLLMLLVFMPAYTPRIMFLILPALLLLLNFTVLEWIPPEVLFFAKAGILAAVFILACGTHKRDIASMRCAA